MGTLGKYRDLLAAVASGFVGALALATSTYNVYLQRQQVKASVWPHVTMDTASTDEGAFSIVIPQPRRRPRAARAGARHR